MEREKDVVYSEANFDFRGPRLFEIGALL